MEIPFAPMLDADLRYIGGIFLMPLYVEIMIENTELIMTTKRIPESFKPISKIANGTQAMLGNDCSPTANEFIVLPK
jgi:hypothetical protein